MKTIKLIGVMALIASISGCSDSDNARRVLESSGYTDVKTTGYSMFSCGKDDAVSTGFTAKGPNGKNIEGAVCSGLIFKNSTIRIN